MPIELAKLLSPERTRFGQALPSKKRAFELLGGLLSDNPDSPFQQQHIFDQLLHRERLGNTAIGGGIALPRARAELASQALIKNQYSFSFHYFYPIMTLSQASNLLNRW